MAGLIRWRNRVVNAAHIIRNAMPAVLSARRRFSGYQAFVRRLMSIIDVFGIFTSLSSHTKNLIMKSLHIIGALFANFCLGTMTAPVTDVIFSASSKMLTDSQVADFHEAWNAEDVDAMHERLQPSAFFLSLSLSINFDSAGPTWKKQYCF